MTFLQNWDLSALDTSALSSAVEHAAQLAADEMGRNAPRDDDGDEHMADHIDTSSGQKNGAPYTDVGIDDGRFFYWKFDEYGTEHQAAEPFVRPALSKTYKL